jgi:hypothetical protein
MAMARSSWGGSSTLSDPASLAREIGSRVAPARRGRYRGGVRWVLLVGCVTATLGQGAPARGDGPGIVVEGEALAGRARATQGRVAAQDMRPFGAGWSANAHLSWVPPSAGHQLRLLLPVERAGEYDLSITYTRAANHADFVVFVGGAQRGGVQRGFAARAVPSGPVALGRVRLAAGPNEVVVTGTGKDPRSVGFVVGIDRFDLVPVGSATPPVARPPVRPLLPAPSGPVVRLPPRGITGFVRPWSRTVDGWRAVARAASPVLEVEVVPASGTEFAAQYGPEVLVDPERGDPLQRTFRVEHRLPGAASAVWQACRFEPPPMAKGWKEPPGLVAEGDLARLPAAGAQGTFTIDFADFYTPPARQDAEGRPRAGSRVLDARAGPIVLTRPPRRVAPRSTGAAPTGAVRVAPTSALEPWFGSLERVFWVRVACLDARGELLAFPSNAVRVRFGRTPPVEIDLSNLDRPDPEPEWLASNRARLRILEYQPVRWEASDAHKRWVVSGPWPAASVIGESWPFGPLGTRLYLSGEKADKDLWETITGAIGDLVTAFVDAVNWVSQAYETLKREAVDAVARFVPSCDAKCRDVLAAGLEIGLAAVGLPPEIPDFDKLVEMGKGHLTDVLVEEALAQGLPGVTEPLAREAAARLLDEVERRSKEKADRGPSGASWLRPDPDFQYRPAFFRLELANPGTQVLRPRLTLMVVGGEPWGWVFRQVNLNLPPIKPGERKEIPIFLEHDAWYWEAKDAREHGGVISGTRASDAWWAAYTGPCRLLASVQAEVTNPQTGERRLGHSTHGLDQPADRPFR